MRPENNQIAKKRFGNSGAQICGFLGVRTCMGWETGVVENRNIHTHGLSGLDGIWGVIDKGTMLFLARRDNILLY